MKFKLYREFGSLNSVKVFDAVEKGLRNCGELIVSSDEEIPVIWSVLWNGRMERNKLVYERCRRERRPIMIIEVGNLKRNVTWRISLNHINRLGEFGNDRDLDLSRPARLTVDLKPNNIKRNSEILIACQHQKSLQWAGMPAINQWLDNTIREIRKYSDRKIKIRPHPRSNFHYTSTQATVERPKMIRGTYDDFDITYDYHCVINHNSGPAIQAAIAGTPVITDETSLAWSVSGKLENIENIVLPDREDWLLKLSHTERTVDEIAAGIPFARLAHLYK